ncbi:MFS transporter [Pseudomonas brenneri]
MQMWARRAALLLSLLAGHGSASAMGEVVLSAEEQRWIEAHPLLRVGVAEDSLPFEYMKGSQLHGRSLYYLELMSHLTGIRFSYIPSKTQGERERIPLSNFIGSPLSALLLKMDGVADFAGWQWLLMLEALPAIILGLLALKVLPNRPSEAKWLTQQEQDWLSGQLTKERAARESTTQKHPHSVSGMLKSVFTNKYIWVLSVIYMGSSATSNTLSLWMPQILKSFHLSNMQTGLLNMIPFGIAAVFMIYWGMRADKSGERVKATAIPLAITAVSFAATLFTDSLTITLVLLTLVLMGNYAIKGPFWALCSETLPPATLATGIAAINTFAHLGTGAMSSVIGVLRDQTGSFPMALMPLCALTATGSLLVFLVGKQNRRAEQVAAISS